jgi:hypothetical protein
VSSVVPAPKGSALLLENPPSYFSFEEWPEKGIPVGTPDWVKKIIQESQEWNKSNKQSPEKKTNPFKQSKTEDDIPF